MRIAVYQFDTVWMDEDKNLSLVHKACAQLQGKCDLLVLPEMFTTGFTMKPHEVPFDWQQKTFDTLTTFASTYHLAVCGSVVTQRLGSYYNTFVFVEPNGKCITYDKIHLFSLAGEDQVYEAGNEVVLIDYLGWKIQPMICYDLRFPYLIHHTVNHPELIIYCANWPKARIDHWTTLLKARAIENQCYVVGVNRTGIDQNQYEYNGQSMIIEYSGNVLVALEERENVVIKQVDLESLKKYRLKLPFLQDRKSM